MRSIIESLPQQMHLSTRSTMTLSVAISTLRQCSSTNSQKQPQPQEPRLLGTAEGSSGGGRGTGRARGGSPSAPALHRGGPEQTRASDTLWSTPAIVPAHPRGAPNRRRSTPLPCPPWCPRTLCGLPLQAQGIFTLERDPLQAQANHGPYCIEWFSETYEGEPPGVLCWGEPLRGPRRPPAQRPTTRPRRPPRSVATIRGQDPMGRHAGLHCQRVPPP